jgi:hypothetical protein
MWAFLTIVPSVLIIAMTVHDCFMRYYDYKETIKRR